MTNFTRTSIALAVLCAMPTGYRRAGFALKKGENSLEATEEQFDALSADINLTVTRTLAFTEENIGEPINDNELREQLALVAEQYNDLVAENHILVAKVKVLEEQLEKSLLTVSEDTLADLIDEGEVIVMDFAWAGEELAPFISAINTLHVASPLTKKPYIAELDVADVGKPSAEQRDQAWQYYLDNVINHVPG